MFGRIRRSLLFTSFRRSTGESPLQEQAYLAAKVGEAERALTVLRYERWLRGHGGLRMAAAIIFDTERELVVLRGLVESWGNVQSFRIFAADYRAGLDAERCKEGVKHGKQ